MRASVFVCACTFLCTYVRMYLQVCLCVFERVCTCTDMCVWGGRFLRDFCT